MNTECQVQSEAVLELKGVTRVFQLGKTQVHALRGVEMTIRRGEFVALVGPSGSGKTTLLNIIGCLDSATAGQYIMAGKEIREQDIDRLAELRNLRIGFIFQTFNLIPVLDVLENIEFPLLLRPGASSEVARRKAQELADIVGLTPYLKHKPDELSGGQRQRVAIARALVTEPEFILADEPTANLDSANADAILDLMQRLNEERGVTFVLSTHDGRVVDRCRRVIHLVDGVVDKSR